ncbi:hypothetical protein V8F06_004645, partial [Rhypophila decipiens]
EEEEEEEEVITTKSNKKGPSSELYIPPIDLFVWSRPLRRLPRRSVLTRLRGGIPLLLLLVGVHRVNISSLYQCQTEYQNQYQNKYRYRNLCQHLRRNYCLLNLIVIDSVWVSVWE